MATASPEDSSPASRPFSRARIVLWLLILICIACIIRVYGTGDFAYTSDETMDVRISATPDLHDLWRFGHYETHPPVLFFLEHYWMKISDDPAFVRGLPLLFGLLLVVVYYNIGALLNGQVTGLCCATLVAFSYGCILQSYTVRQYMFMLPFASLALYCGLLWCRRPGLTVLLGYVASAALACMSHFSAIFVIFCIAVYATVLRWHRGERAERQIAWTLANVLVVCLWAIFYHSWLPALDSFRTTVTESLAGSLSQRIGYALFYPIVATGYILPSYGFAFLAVPALAAAAFVPERFIPGRKNLRPLLLLTVLAMLLGMALLVSGLYVAPGTRHGLWILPFIVPPLGWIIGDAIAYLARTAAPRYGSDAGTFLTASLIAVVACGPLTYSVKERFSNNSEYNVPVKEWLSLNRYLEQLTSRDLIIAERDDAVLLVNIYPLLGTAAEDAQTMAAIADVGHTRLLFNPYYRRTSSRNVIVATLQEALNRHFLDGVDRLVFLHGSWDYSPLYKLFTCPELAATIVTFPASTYVRHFTPEDFRHIPFIVMLVSKEELLNALMKPDGKARACLLNQHDPVEKTLLPFPAGLSFPAFSPYAAIPAPHKP